MTNSKSLSAVLLLLGLLGALPALAQSTPSMNLEGSGGIISFNGGSECSGNICAGTFTATVSGVLGQSVQNLSFTLNFDIPFLPTHTGSGMATSAIAKKPKKPTLQQQVDALQSQVAALQQDFSQVLAPGCFPAYGTGTSSDGAYTISFDGQFCASEALEVLSGAVAIVSTAGPQPPDFNVDWASGTLVASGSAHCCSGEYIPHLSNEIIVSIVGALGKEFEGP